MERVSDRRIYAPRECRCLVARDRAARGLLYMKVWKVESNGGSYGGVDGCNRMEEAEHQCDHLNEGSDFGDQAAVRMQVVKY